MKKESRNIIIICVLTLVVAILGSVFVNLGMDWFNALVKPKQWIPNFVIPIVWTIIYVLFAIILSVLAKNYLSTKLVVLSLINGALNILWCFVFFTLNQLLLGNIVILVNLFFGLWLFVELVKQRKWFVYIFAIYPIWLLIATTLNNALWIIN